MTLELCITDFCNLNCKLCDQGTPLNKKKGIMSLEYLRILKKYNKPFEFRYIKISGGEPTLHPHFDLICKEIKELFPANFYILATNGCLLENYLNYIQVFDRIELSIYPGKNDDLFLKLLKYKIPNMVPFIKVDFKEMDNIYKKSNLNKENVYLRCKDIFPPTIKKIVQNRIYKCCNIFGLALRQKINLEKISVKFDHNWRNNLEEIKIEEYCKRCHFNVDLWYKYPNLRNFLIILDSIKRRIALMKFLFKNRISIKVIIFYVCSLRTLKLKLLKRA